MAKTKNDADKNKIVTFKYGRKETILVLSICGAVLASLIIASIVLWLWIATIILAVITLVLIVCLLIDGVLRPIYICDRHVAFRGKKMLWKDIRITLYPSSKRYELIIGTAYVRDKKKFKQQAKILPCVSLKDTKFLNDIIPYYKAKFLVLNRNGVEEKPRPIGINKDINQLIIEHNSQCTK